MGLFSEDIIESTVKIPLRLQFATELSAKIKKNRFKLLNARRTHGLDSVLNCLEMYVCQLKGKSEYESMSITGRNPWDVDERTGVERIYSTYIKGNIYIVIRTGSSFAGKPRNEDEYGSITIVLDKNLRETSFRITKYDSSYY